MTQEEKAKAYDKAIEKIMYVMQHGVSPVLNKEDLQDIFPELKESKDERIRKVQLDYWRSVGGKEWHEVPVQEAIAWLEKQGEPKWSEEDERGSDETIELLEYFINYAPEFRKPAIRRSIDWLKEIKQAMEQ